jgi:hypothetical protein
MPAQAVGGETADEPGVADSSGSRGRSPQRFSIVHASKLRHQNCAILFRLCQIVTNGTKLKPSENKKTSKSPLFSRKIKIQPVGIGIA